MNTAILLPPDGDAEIVSPPSDSYNAQLACLQTLEEQISTLGVSTLAKQNLTNSTAEAKRLDRIDSDSIMAIMSEDLQRAINDILISAELRRILREGEVLPPYVDIDEEIVRTKDEVDDKFDLQMEQMEAMQAAQPEPEGGVTSGSAASGSTKGSQTLPTPLRSGKNAD